MEQSLLFPRPVIHSHADDVPIGRFILDSAGMTVFEVGFCHPSLWNIHQLSHSSSSHDDRSSRLFLGRRWDYSESMAVWFGLRDDRLSAMLKGEKEKRGGVIFALGKIGEVGVWLVPWRRFWDVCHSCCSGDEAGPKMENVEAAAVLVNEITKSV